jgi:hypothetical protein
MRNVYVASRIRSYTRLAAAVLVSLPILAGVPAAAQQAGPGFSLVAGHWSRGAADSIAWVDLATWRLVTSTEGHLAEDPQPQPWLPVTGDWDGDGIDTVQMFNVHDWRLVPLDRGPVTGETAEPQPVPWLPVAGDWDGDGIDTVLVFDQRDGSTHRLEEGPPRIGVFDPQPSSWRPLAGDWEGIGRETIASYQDDARSPDSQGLWGTVAGKWNGGRIDTVAFVHLPTGTLVSAEEAIAAAAFNPAAVDRKRSPAPLPGKNNQPGSGCYTAIKNYSSVVKVFKYGGGGCMVLVLEAWNEWHCCAISSGQPAYFACTQTFKFKTTSHGYSNC